MREIKSLDFNIDVEVQIPVISYKWIPGLKVEKIYTVYDPISQVKYCVTTYGHQVFIFREDGTFLGSLCEGSTIQDNSDKPKREQAIVKIRNKRRNK